MLGQAFLDLIDQAFVYHRHWRETQDGQAYFTWASGFKVRINPGRTHLVNKGSINGFIENLFNYFALIENSDVYI